MVDKQNKNTKIPPQNSSINFGDCLLIYEIIIGNNNDLKQLHPSNKYISKQTSFFSTRSRHEKPKRRYAKPSRQEEEQIKGALFNDVKLYSNSKTKEISKG